MAKKTTKRTTGKSTKKKSGTKPGKPTKRKTETKSKRRKNKPAAKTRKKPASKARKATKRKSATKSAKRTSTAERIKKLEKAVAALKRSQTAIRAHSADRINAPGIHIVGLTATEADSASLKVTKTAASPNFVRVSVKGYAGYVLNVGETEGKLDGLTAGSLLIVRMEVQGNPFDKGTVKFSDGSPDSMTIEIPKDENANNGMETVVVL